MSKKVPVIFHNLKGYDSHLIFKELIKFNVKISVIPNGSEKYMAFTLNRNLVFIDSMQFMNCSLDSLIKNLGIKILNIYPKNKVVIPMSIWTVLKDLTKRNYLISLSFFKR